MAKSCSSGANNAPWKRNKSGVFNPGNMGTASGADVTAVQELIQRVFLAAGQKNMVIVCSAEWLETVSGAVSRQYNVCKNRIDYVQATAGSRLVFTASDSGINGKPCISGTGAKFASNATDLPAPSAGTPYTQISVNRLDSWPPGSRCWYGSTANRFGAYTRSTPDSIQISNNNVAPSPPVDQPLGRWGVMHYQMSNATTDFVRFGATANTATGVNVGNTNPASLGKMAIATGTQGIAGSEAIQFGWNAILTGAEHNAVDDELAGYFGGDVLIYSSVGNIRSSGIGWYGSSQTFFSQGAAVNFRGARYRFYTNYWDTLEYPIWTSGHTVSGNWPQPANDGISGLGIDIDAGGPNPGIGLANAIVYFSPGGAAPNAGAGAYRLINLELGGADVLGGTYVPVTSAANLLAIAKQLQTSNPNATIGINTICPQLGNPAGVATFSAEIRDPGGVWDQFDTWALANGYRVCARIDLNFAVSGGTGLYVVANFVDAVHLNQTGQFLWGDEINTKTAVAMSAATTY